MVDLKKLCQERETKIFDDIRASGEHNWYEQDSDFMEQIASVLKDMPSMDHFGIYMYPDRIRIGPIIVEKKKDEGILWF